MQYITWESGFEIKMKVGLRKVKIKLSKGSYFIFHRTKVKKSKVKLDLDSSLCYFQSKEYLYIYFLAGKIIYSNTMKNTQLTMPFYLIEFDLKNGEIHDYRIIDYRGKELNNL